ncbi:MAG: hypothetical protein AAFV38_06760 [Pseudomonadota bacterium]
MDVTHTELTRRKGEAPDLPPLERWLGTGVDTDRVELFPVADLQPMSLGDYLVSAHDVVPEAVLQDEPLHAIEGHVLLVPEDALYGTPSPGPELQLVAVFGLIEPDNAVRPLPPADVAPQSITPPQSDIPRMSDARMSGMVALAALVVLGLLTVLIVVMA